MKSLLTIASQTFGWCLRMKMAAGCIFLLLVVLLILPTVMTGDGTLSGSIRSFLSHGMGLTALILSVAVILISVGAVTGDQRLGQIQILMSKPLSRSGYLLGRWAGVTAFFGMLLLLVGAGMVFYAQDLRVRDHWRGEPVTPTDRRTIESEIFTARDQAHPILPDYPKLLDNRIREMREQERYRPALESYRVRYGLSEALARHRIEKELMKQIRAEIEGIPSRKGRRWRFGPLNLEETDLRSEGTVRKISADRKRMRIAAPQKLLGRLLFAGPVRVAGIRGRVIHLREDFFDVFFGPDDLLRAPLSGLKPQSAVALTAEPTLQLKFKVGLTEKSANDQTVHRLVQLRNSAGAILDEDDGTCPVGSSTTTIFSAANLPKGEEFSVVYWNGSRRRTETPPAVRIRMKDISLLYRTGGFGPNLLRAGVLIFCQLAFLAALGVWAGSFLSFSVATPLCMVLLVCGLLVGFLADTVFWGGYGAQFGDDVDFSTRLGGWVVRFLQWILPNLSETTPTEKIVAGLRIAPESLVKTLAVDLGLKSAFYLTFGCLVFRKRELAQVLP